MNRLQFDENQEFSNALVPVEQQPDSGFTAQSEDPATLGGLAEKFAKELGLNPDEQCEVASNFALELRRRAPDLAKVLYVLAALPVLARRATAHFHHAKGESLHDAEELSQAFVQKILAALTGAWPRRNIGAWLSTIRKRGFIDNLRKRGRAKRGMERLEQAATRMRR